MSIFRNLNAQVRRTNGQTDRQCDHLMPSLRVMMVVAMLAGEVRLFDDDDCDDDKDCNADTDNSDDDNGDHEWIIIRPQTNELVCLCEEDDSDGKDGEDGDNDDGDYCDNFNDDDT
ncbi:hypothetical protein DPMN_089052 [Dreissena polymorpha]|uniref:Uncharacterized protein n=1 Tax=Dreissena polymorpha TaxID=45954 RepID=A0A9D4QX29_DREPO|nr:hypothetical protein DPMN_089052 [Dreissena polymorpha]